MPKQKVYRQSPRRPGPPAEEISKKAHRKSTYPDPKQATDQGKRPPRIWNPAWMGSRNDHRGKA